MSKCRSRFNRDIDGRIKAVGVLIGHMEELLTTAKKYKKFSRKSQENFEVARHHLGIVKNLLESEEVRYRFDRVVGDSKK